MIRTTVPVDLILGTSPTPAAYAQPVGGQVHRKGRPFRAPAGLLCRLRRALRDRRPVMRPVLYLLLLPILAMLLLRAYATQQVAAKRFNVGERTIRNWISEGKITGYRLPGGRAIRVDLAEIEAMIKVIPTVRAGKPLFGPKARIVTVGANEPVAEIIGIGNGGGGE